MKWMDFVSKTGDAVSKALASLDARLDKRECYTKLKSYTTAERDAIKDPETGYLIWNTTTGAVNVYNGTAWAAV